MKLTYFAATAFLASALPAFANQCPTLADKIDEAMKTATVDEATKTEIMALYDKGKAEHEAGDHAASQADLGEALRLLGM